MRRAGRLTRLILTGLVAASATVVATPSGTAIAQTSRDQLAQTYLQYKQSEPLYQSAPVSHVTPVFNTITYAFAGDYRNVTVQPSAQQYVNGSESLKLGGYTASPYLALSLKYVGLGFSAQQGVRTASYSQTPNQGNSYALQQSQLDFTSVGAYLYLIPFQNLPKWVTASVVLGGGSYTAKHQVSQDYGSNGPSTSIPADDSQIFRYNVNRYEGGVDLTFRVFKNFAIIPWMDYTVTDAAAGDQLTLSNGQEPSDGSVQGNLKEDILLFWFDQPRLQYGIDFAVHIAAFEVHLGDALGLVASLNRHSDQIKDGTITLSVAVNQKAN